MKLYGIPLVVLMLSSLLTGTSAAAAGAAVSERTLWSTVYIRAQVTDRTEAVASGVIIAVRPNVIVMTARHIAARKNLSLRTFSGEPLAILAEYEVADRDVALLVAAGSCAGCEAAEIAGTLTVGERIHVWGNPEGHANVLSPGMVVDLHPTLPGFATNGRIALACDTCAVGDSGGGVFDDRGRLVGIVTEGWEGAGVAKRVIAEPANQALAHVPLEYVAATGSVESGAGGNHSLRSMPAGLLSQLKPDKETVTDLTQSLQQNGSLAIDGIHFDTASANLRVDSLASLDEILRLVESRPGSRWTIAGHTDNQGAAQYNLVLSLARAYSVVTWLTQHGVSADILTAKGYGSTHPVADNATESGRAQNRRVEVSLGE